MIKTAAVFTTFMMLVASPLFAGDKGCCAKNASNSGGMACVNYASLNLTADQKSKIETWQAECVKAGCTKESRHTFLKQAKGVLSAEQFAKLKEQCKTAKDETKTKA